MDFRIEQWINNPAGHQPFWDPLLQLVAARAEPAFIVLVAAWFAAGWLRRQAADRRGAITALLAAVVALAINQGISHLWFRPRPFVSHPADVHLLVGHVRDASFPSDHAAAAFAIAAVLLAFHRRLGLVLLAVAALLAYARVYVGDHYPGDVLAGALIGLVVAGALMTWLNWLPALVARLGDDAMARVRLLPAESGRE